MANDSELLSKIDEVIDILNSNKSRALEAMKEYPEYCRGKYIGLSHAVKLLRDLRRRNGE